MQRRRGERGPAPPPHVADGQAARMSITPITLESTHRVSGSHRLWQAFGATFAATAALFLAFSLGRLASDDSPAVASRPAPVVAVTAITPPAPPSTPSRAPEPRVLEVRENPSAPASARVRRRLRSTKKPVIAAPEPLASLPPTGQPSTRVFGDVLPAPVRKIRPLDTENPFMK